MTGGVCPEEGAPAPLPERPRLTQLQTVPTPKTWAEELADHKRREDEAEAAEQAAAKANKEK